MDGPPEATTEDVVDCTVLIRQLLALADTTGAGTDADDIDELTTVTGAGEGGNTVAIEQVPLLATFATDTATGCTVGIVPGVCGGDPALAT